MSWIVTNTCWDETEFVPVEVCDQYWEDDDDNWEQDFPIGGSNTSNNGIKENFQESKRQAEYKKKMEDVKKILSSFNIDISKYNIRLNSDGCATNARVLLDGTIEICTQALNFTSSDMASILWHEIYHFDNEHYNTVKTGSSCEPFYLVLDNNISPYFETFLDYKYDGFGTKEDYANEFLLRVDWLASMDWYSNEIDTYRAELDNGIERSSTYDAEVHFMLWYYEQIYNYIKDKQQ